jgi:hypothetical protein
MLVALIVAAAVAYITAVATYRLFLSPIAQFPGPTLAALSRWYEFYYEVVLRGQFTFHIAELHKKYGRSTRLLSPLSFANCCRTYHQNQSL